jgi:hypothetical protein
VAIRDAHVDHSRALHAALHAAAVGAALVGLASGAGLGLLLLLDALAVASIVRTLRRLWRLRHSSRWQYAFVAAALMVFVSLFTLNDAGLL